MNTARKITIARVLLQVVRAGRALSGRTTSEVVCRRRGARWSLDIREGVQLALYLGVYERGTYRRLRALVAPGDVVIDVGANVGAHTIPLAAAVGPSGHVVAVEPTDDAFHRLKVNLSLNAGLSGRVTAVQAALGVPGGRATDAYYSSWPLDGEGDRLHPVHLGAPASAAAARFTTLDDIAATLAPGRVALVKVDVDGGELDVMQGGEALLDRDRPAVVMEFCPYLLRDGRAEALVNLFGRHGYGLFDEQTMASAGTTAADVLRGIPEFGGRNLVALPLTGRSA